MNKSNLKILDDCVILKMLLPLVILVVCTYIHM